jgi:hypothetical protein
MGERATVNVRDNENKRDGAGGGTDHYYIILHIDNKLMWDRPLLRFVTRTACPQLCGPSFATQHELLVRSNADRPLLRKGLICGRR